MSPSDQGLLIEKPEWCTHERTFVCHAVFYRDEENGGYTVVARNLPGVVSEGNDTAEAMTNIVAAFSGAIESYEACGMKIPWGDSIDMYGGDFEFEKRLLVTPNVR